MWIFGSPKSTFGSASDDEHVPLDGRPSSRDVEAVLLRLSSYQHIERGFGVLPVA